ncbi:MAG: hypothetical protein H6Q60_1099 [Oscillospiraceae bacterium]|nr:hypothetical protein [Oscillospiraceae bacterium]
MNRIKKQSPLFLTELIFSLVIFSLCAAVCVSLIVRAQTISTDSRQLSQALMLAETVAEEFKAEQPLTESRDGYQVSTQQRTEHGVAYLDITVSLQDEPVYQLTAARVEQEEGAS